jgi:hypothetical protein
MQAQNRLVSRPTRPIALAGMLAVAFAVALFAVALFTGVMHTAQPAKTNSHVTVFSPTLHDQAPDAKDRNAIYSQALSARYKNQSPDAQDRNLQLSLAQTSRVGGPGGQIGDAP